MHCISAIMHSFSAIMHCISAIMHCISAMMQRIPVILHHVNAWQRGQYHFNGEYDDFYLMERTLSYESV
jgi:hypothetical protein